MRFHTKIDFIVRLLQKNVQHLSQDKIFVCSICSSVGTFHSLVLQEYLLIKKGKFSRKIAIRLGPIVFLAPIIGYFRVPFVVKKYKDQLQAQNSQKQTQVKQTLGQAFINFSSSNNDFQYMILVKSEKQYDGQELYQKQKILFNINNQILAKTSESDHYFDGVKFMFIGQDSIYEDLKSNLPQQKLIKFEFINKQNKTMTIPKEDSILLIAKDSNGDNRILMEWPFDSNVNLKTIIRIISKHKYKKFVQSMDF